MSHIGLGLRADAESADLEVLTSSQAKLDALTGSMTQLLSTVDGRLRTLEETNLLPLQRRIARVLRARSNAQRTLKVLERSADQSASVADLEPRIRAGPAPSLGSRADPGQLAMALPPGDPDAQDEVGNYLTLLDEVKSARIYLDATAPRGSSRSNGAMEAQMQELLQTGAEQIVDLLTAWWGVESEQVDVRDYIGSSGRRGSGGNLPLPSISLATTQTALGLLNYLSTIELPLPARLANRAQHVPQDPADRAPFQTYALAMYMETRAAYAAASLQPAQRAVTRFANEMAQGEVSTRRNESSVAYTPGQNGVGDLLKGTYEICTHEVAEASGLVSSLDPLPPPPVAAELLLLIPNPSLTGAVSAITKMQSNLAHPAQVRNLTARTVPAAAALDTIGALHVHLPLIDKAFAEPGLGTGRGTQLVAQLRDQQVKLRHLCAAALAGVYAAFRQAGETGGEGGSMGGGVTTAVHPAVHDAFQALTTLHDYRAPGGQVLGALPAYGWRTVPPAPLRDDTGAKISPENQAAAWKAYVMDLLKSTMDMVETRSRSIRQASTAAIFILNNLSYLRQNLGAEQFSLLATSEPESDELLEKTIRSAKTVYLDAWSPLVQALMEEKPGSAVTTHGHQVGGRLFGGGSEKAATKERLASFYEALDEVARLHRAYPFRSGDSEMRANLRRDVSRLIMPLYKTFVTKARTSGFSKDPSKHIRLTENEVQARIDTMFA